MPGMFPQMGGFPGMGTGTGAPCAPAAPKVTVHLISTRPAEVSANVYPGADSSGGLVCDPLRPEVGTGPAIDPAIIVTDPGAIKITVQITAQQAPGRYRGSIRRKQDSCAAGDLLVTIV